MKDKNLRKLRPFQLCALQNFPFIEADFDVLTNYEMMCKIVEYLKKVIDNSNSQNTKINELGNIVNELENYFENLDVQEEINNKLDEMAENGQLTDIIAQYLGLAGVLAFNTLNDLVNAENITNGSICKTLGTNTYNDGEGNYYKIRTVTTDDIIDNNMIVALSVSNTLIAEKILNLKLHITPEDFGCIGDGETDDTENFEKCVEYAKENNYLIVSDKNKTYLINDTIDISNIALNLNYATIKTNSNIDIFEIDETDNTKYTFVNNIIFDLNNVGVSAIKLTEGRRNRFNNIFINNVNTYGIKVLLGYENMFDNINIQNVIGSPNTNTIGFLIETGDCNFENITMTNMTTAFYTKCGNNTFEKCHSWIGTGSLLNDSVMFLIEDTLHNPLFLNNIYCDTYRYFVKYNNNIYNNLYISNLKYLFNETIYTSNYNDTYVIYTNTDDQVRFVDFTNSSIIGLSYVSGAKSYLTNRTNYLGKKVTTTLSGITYNDSNFTLTDTSSGLTLTVNSVKKNNETNIVNITAVGSYNSASSNSDIVLNLGKLNYDLLPSAGITCFDAKVADTRWESTSATSCYLYIPSRSNANDPITMRVPHGTGTKYVFINISYIR